jgi:hypothetical protein
MWQSTVVEACLFPQEVQRTQSGSQYNARQSGDRHIPGQKQKKGERGDKNRVHWGERNTRWISGVKARITATKTVVTITEHLSLV